MRVSNSLPSAILSFSVILASVSHALPVPMEPAERTLFVFVHGVNPRSAGAIEGDMDGKSGFCVDDKELMGRAAFAWVRDLNETPSDNSLFCSLKKNVFGSKYSLRAFSDPGATPVTLAQELGDRTWKNDAAGLKSHVVEGMRRYLEARRDTASSWKPRQRLLSAFESKLLMLYPSGAITNLKPIFEAFPDSVPSRVVVLAHSMGGLTTREYLMSDFYNADIDKVVTYDTPHGGSWSGYYNQDGSWNAGKAIIEDGAKIMIGCNLIASPVVGIDQVGMFYIISGMASTTAGFATQFAGVVGNGFVGNEAANWYLPPNSAALRALNSKQSIPCEKNGCRIPSFMLHGVDGVIAPDDPDKFVGTGVAGYVLPLEAVDAAMAFGMTMNRPWPGSMSTGEVIGNSMVAGSFAFGGWNYTQHGSLVVPLNSSRADGIPFLSRPEVRRSWKMVDWNQEGKSSLGALKQGVGTWSNMGSRAVAIEALTLISLAQPWLAPEIGPIKVAMGLSMGVLYAVEMGAYSWAAGPSHNATIWLNASRKDLSRHVRGDGSEAQLRFTEAEADLYEDPFAQLASERFTDSTGEPAFRLGVNTGTDDLVSNDLVIPVKQFQDIHYASTGWDHRFAVREERHVPVQDSSTRVREVTRRNLPVEILTTKQISAMDLRIDDLRPDLMEQMEIGLNWGMFRFVWDRDHDAQGNPAGTFTLRSFENGKQVACSLAVANPIDVYGRWHVPLRKLVRPNLQVLIDGQNLIGISLVNHVGKFSAQSQFITFQATPPVVAMEFPRPYQTISDTSVPARFEANILYYGGIRFDTLGAAWSLTPISRPRSVQDERRIPGLMADDSVQTLELPMSAAFANGSDGPWELGLRIQSVLDASKQNGSPAMRRFPLWLDRSAPVFRISSQSHAVGEPWRFLATWADLPEGLADVVQLVRLRVRDSSKAVVAELPPMEFATGGSRLVVWDGLVNGKPARDGRYTLEIVGKDGAVPNPEVEGMLLSLRRELLANADSGARVWTPRRDSLWSHLQNLPHMNWGMATDTFVVDRTPPRVVAGVLPIKTFGVNGHFLLPLDVSDAGACFKRDSVRVRLTFHNAATKYAFTTGLVIMPVSGDSSRPTKAHFAESGSASGLVPDGEWVVSITARDPDGNVDSFTLPGTLRIDRSPPEFAFLSPSPSYVSSAAAKIEGHVGLEIKGASSITAAWKSSSGKSLAGAPVSVAEGMWTVSYPDALRSEKGAWVLEVVAKDAAGNETRSSTFVQVDLVPPRLKVPSAIQGPVVIKGLAMDPELDEYRFRSYELSWREAGATEWTHEGMRIPRGRGTDSVSWRSLVEQSVEGVLGFWDPPSGIGAVELRVSVDDGSGRVFEAKTEAYVTSSDAQTFSVNVSALPDSLVSGMGARVGFDVVASGKDQSFDAQATLVDGRGSILWIAHPKDVKASPLDGRPDEFTTGAFHLWTEKGGWHLHSSGPCRDYRAILQTWSSSPLSYSCPKGWTCRQDSLSNASYSIAGDTFQVNRLVEWTIPSGSVDSIAWNLDKPGRIVFMPQGAGASCAIGTGCADLGSLSSTLPAPGEVRMGRNAEPMCGGAGSIALNRSQGSFSGMWDGFRQNGSWPDGGTAILEADVWDDATSRVVHASKLLPLKAGTLGLGAKALGGVVFASDAPVVQSQAALEFTLEGRGAAVVTRIVQNGMAVRTLEGSGIWREGRPITQPYRLEWDGMDDKGSPVPSGSYTFEVVADSLRATADVLVGGSSWRSDSSLKLSFGQGEAQWSSALNAWKLAPPPLLRVGTGAEGFMDGGLFHYGVRYEGKQDVTAFRLQRPSLMVRRKRNRVKYGLLWKISTRQQGYDSDKGAFSGCKGRGNPVYVTQYRDGGVVEMGRGETVSREVSVHVQPNPGETTYRMQDGPHFVEYVAVPLSVYQEAVRKSLTEKVWDNTQRDRVSSGSFRIDDLKVTPTYGLNDTRGPFVNGFASKPNAPRKCAAGYLKDLDGDSVMSQEEWLDTACTEPMTDPDQVNPNRNLIWFGVRTTHQQVFFDGLRSKLRSSYIWDNNTAHAECAPNDLTDFTFGFDIKIPDEFFDADPGIDNLANRLLRFDPANEFLYGSDGFLAKDGYDNDGNGVVDDPSEASGFISPFETRSYQWRPVWEDPTSAFPLILGGCLRSNHASTEVFPVDSGWVATRPSGFGWIRIGEIAPCSPQSERFCQSWLQQTMATCSTVVAEEGASNILQDKLNFYEGDHSLNPDSLFFWFTNLPEQGDAEFVATVRQGDTTRSVDSRIHRDPQTAQRMRLKRGGSIFSWNGFTLLQNPVQITVGVRSDLTGFTSTSGDLATIDWPLDSTSWQQEKRRIEGGCNPGIDPTSCRRIFAAASGVRFGMDDGLDSVLAGTAYTSSAQQHFFSLRSDGVPANPDGVAGLMDSSEATLDLTGTLRSDGIGRSAFVDSIHFRDYMEELPSGIHDVHAVPVANGFQVEGPDSSGKVRFIGQSSETWSLSLDPRMGGRDRLQSLFRWTPGVLRAIAPLAGLYRASTLPRGTGSQEMSLYREFTSGILSPNTSSLSGITLKRPSISWRDGSDASAFFEAESRQADLTRFPQGVEMKRTSLQKRIPEWIAVRGAVPSGSIYQLGWAAPGGGWRPLGDSVSSLCSPDSVLKGTCFLGLVDASTLPEKGRILLRVHGGTEVRFDAVPFLQGTTLPATGGVMHSLFGDAQVVFPSGSISSKSESERTVSVRILSPQEAGLPASSGISVFGPVVEVLPSQTFSGTNRPEIVLRLPRSSFQTTGGAETDPTSVQLYKVDATTGTVVPLESQTRHYMCGGSACMADKEWTEIEFHGLTSSFSRFALLPGDSIDSRMWTISVLPVAGPSLERTLEIRGIDASELDLWWDDDPSIGDAGDLTPPGIATIVQGGSSQMVRMPDRAVSWLHARRRAGGLARSIRLEKLEGEFTFRIPGSDTLWVGRSETILRIPYETNHRGELRMAALAGGSPVAWAGTTFDAPGGFWNFVLPSDWEELPDLVTTRIVATDVGGRTIENPGPVIVFDRTRPIASLSVSLRRERGAWRLLVQPTGSDDRGLAAISLHVETSDGISLGTWNTLEARELRLADSAWNPQSERVLRVVLALEDRGGNKVESSWSSLLISPEQTSLLWLLPSGSASFGWGVDDLGRHLLKTSIQGLSSWRDDALAFLDPTTSVVTDSVAEVGVAEATVELLGAWDTSATLLERVGQWSLRREGRDAVFQSGAFTVRWNSIFAATPRWMHLALVLGKTEIVLYRDGRPVGARAWSSSLHWSDSRSWAAGGGGDAARLGLVRVWGEALDSSAIALWRSEALGIDSVVWTEAEALAGDAVAERVPHCELPSRLAVAPRDSTRILNMAISGPRQVRVAGRWISDAPRPVILRLDGVVQDTALLEPILRWGALSPWRNGLQEIELRIPAGSHRLSVQVPPGLQLDGLALVSGEGLIERWSPLDSASIPPSVEVLVRDESPNETNAFKPRIVVKNLSKTTLPGYRLHVQMRSDAWKPPVLETWWPVPLSSSIDHDGHGLFTWTMDRSEVAIPSGQSDFGSSGASVGFHYRDWSAWTRLDDPSWDSALSSGAWVHSTGIPVFSKDGRLLSEWICRDGTDLDYPSEAPLVQGSLSGASPMVVEGDRAQLLVAAEGNWNWGSTVVGITPLDGRPLSGMLRVGANSWPLSGWWQQITIPNTAHSELTLLLGLDSFRKVQLQKWQQ